MNDRIYGPLTGVPLSQVSPLLLPWAPDPWGRLRPPLSVEAMRLSAELSAATYSMTVEPWIRAGWQDVTIQVDGALTHLEADDHWISAKWKKHRVRARIRQQNPLSQVLGALREKETGTGKAVVMVHPAPDGRYVVAVSFMGTGKRFYDWFSNFRMTTLDGVHKGFHQLTEQFERNEELIEFPELAEELGLEKLTLATMLRDMKSPNSRFVLWLSGHSQGGAVMQVYAHRKLHEDGVLPGNLIGYGFASPSAMTGDAVPSPEAYPLYHVHNSDDLIPHCGAAVHLGVCLTYPADGPLRRACYGWPRDEMSVQARLAVRPIIGQMRDTPSCIIQVLAYLHVLGGYSVPEVMEVLGLGEGLPLTRLLEGRDLSEWLGSILRRTEGAYQCITGTPVPQETLQAAMELLRQTVESLGLRRYTEALLQLMRWPHHISGKRAGMQAAYMYIVRNGVEKLVPSMWRAGVPPVRCIAPRAEGPCIPLPPPGQRALQKRPAHVLAVYRKKARKM